jgi:hypothetical protein
MVDDEDPLAGDLPQEEKFTVAQPSCGNFRGSSDLICHAFRYPVMSG